MCSLHCSSLKSQNRLHGQASVYRPGAAVTGGVCGGVFPGDARFSVGGQFAGRTIAANWTEGSVVEIVIQIYTNHVSVQGHLAFLSPLAARAAAV